MISDHGFLIFVLGFLKSLYLIKMNMKQLEAEAKATAAKHVINMLQRPGQLEKVDQYKRRVTRKKASVEAMLKTAMQSQLDGVRVGLNQLEKALEDMQEIKQNLHWINESFSVVPGLYKELQDVRDENMRHSQYVTAMENLKHIFTVPESVEKTKQWINEGKLLHTHQSLTDMENSRDDLLYELHKLPNQAPADKIMLKAYFEDVQVLSTLLEKQLRLVLSRTLNTVRKEPTVIVTALRIIEREEKADEFALQRQKQSGFLPPGRPKMWRKIAMEVLEKSVMQRIEGTRVDEKADNKMWLVRYLELTRQLILEDLRVVKTLCRPCFPPQYEIVDKFVAMYHQCLSRYLSDEVVRGLEGNEIVSALSWIMNTYPGPELMQHPELNIDTSSLGPLLDDEYLHELQKKYLKYTLENYELWMKKTLETEKAEWDDGRLPDCTDNEEYYHTSAPVIIFQMLNQNLEVSKTVSPEITTKALDLCVEQVISYGVNYGKEIEAFKTRHFADRSQVPFFTHYMITIVNNCLQFRELALQMKQSYLIPGRELLKFATLQNTYLELRNQAVQFLLKEAFLDLESHFQDLVTVKWLQSSIPVDTICVTLEDYFQDYTHLRVENFDFVITEAQNRVAKRYITAMLYSKISFKVYEERRDAGVKMIKESEQIMSFFMRIAPKVASTNSPFEIIRSLAEVLKSEDPELLSLDLHGLVDKYPDVTHDHLALLLKLRGDISRSEIQEKIRDIFEANKVRQRPLLAKTTKTIFSSIP